MMLTDISPIVGLTLIELVELDTLILLGGSAAIAAIIGVANWKLLNQRKKVDSAKRIWELGSSWRNNPEFQEFLEKLMNPKVTKYTEEEMGPVLDRFEYIATFWKDKTIQGHHVESFFGENLRVMQKDQCIQEYIEKVRSENPEVLADLVQLLEKSSELV